MDSNSAPPAVPVDDTESHPRVKFLCSFGGGILPRPLDGKLRYVGGETRIVSVPRDVTFEDLMSRMRELFDGAALLKYQQPDEDLDALVSVVNDDDVTNMMEEYDKLGAGDGFTRLRIFLFSQPDLDVVAPHYNSDERETERRYVDALNSLNDAPSSEFRKIQLDDLHGNEQLYSPISNIEHNQQNSDGLMPPYNLHALVSHPLTGQHGQSRTPRYNEVDNSWSPMCYSPSPPPPHDARTDFPSSPSSGRYRVPFGNIHDKAVDRMGDEYGRHPAVVDNVVWLPPSAIASDVSGFPGNLSHSNSVYEGNNICEHCHMAFQRNPAHPEARYSDSRWRHGHSQVEQPGTGVEFAHFSGPCTECLPGREAYMLSPDLKEHGQKELRPFYNETHNPERSWVVHHHQMNHRLEESRPHVTAGGVRVNDSYVIEGGMNMNYPFTHDGHSASPNGMNHDDPRYVRSATDLGNEGGFHDQMVRGGHTMHVNDGGFHDQTMRGGHTMLLPPLEDCGMRYGNFPPAHGMDNHYQVPHSSSHVHAIQRIVPNPMRGGPSYDASSVLPQANGIASTGFVRGEGSPSPRISRVGVEDQNPWSGHYCGAPQKVFGFDAAAAPEHPHDHVVKTNSGIILQDAPRLIAIEPVPCQPELLDISFPPKALAMVSAPSPFLESNSGVLPYHPVDSSVTATTKFVDEKAVLGEVHRTKDVDTVKESDLKVLSSSKADQMKEFEPNGVRPTTPRDCDNTKIGLGDASVHVGVKEEDLATQLSFLPELIASVKKAALEGAEEVKARVQENDHVHVSPDVDAKELPMNEIEPASANNELEQDSDSDHANLSEIEPTKAEEEALARGLQTIKNDDLEEIRELGSGTYGAVYHGKWKGSDVAIKRIKASCFAGRPSERERLIADFWKEALILSSLHHPNVVSFYGIVRDGPDGSLATVTEFMINGSLKQFLQKKDRTIDRRKRLIIAMDAAFGMEYLHGKNIVHFDLKCENLLVNMRDPHRPVCKIGDLGLSKVRQQTLVSGGVRGTLPWMAPELLSGKSNMVTEKIDVYSFGIVMWELLTGEEPYADMHCASIIGGIVNNTLRPQIPTWCDPEWRSLMESCWSSDPNNRPSFSDISQRLRKMAAAINVK